MIHVLIEENYENNSRAKQVLDGICSVSKKKRISVRIYKDIHDLPSATRVVILICASLKWATNKIAILNELGVHPLLFGFQYIDTLYQYSCINLTYTKAVYLLTKSLLGKNPGHVAFLGYNEDSMPDRLKLVGARYATEDVGETLEVWNNRGDSLACVTDFVRGGSQAKNIVCGNDALAILMRICYPEALEGRLICSCSGMKVAEFMGASYPTAKINYVRAGARLSELYLFLLKQEEISSTFMTLDMDIFMDGEKSEPMDSDIASAILYSASSVDFFGDKNVREIENIENMLLKCDETDFIILRRIMAGESYEKIAESVYLSLNTVKYRINSMLQSAEFVSKKELLNAIHKYQLNFS